VTFEATVELRLSRPQRHPGAFRVRVTDPVVAVDLLDCRGQLEIVKAGLQQIGPVDGQIGSQSEGGQDGFFSVRFLHFAFHRALDDPRPTHGEPVIGACHLGPDLDAPAGVALADQLGQHRRQARVELDIADGVQGCGEDDAAPRVALSGGGGHLNPVGEFGHRGDWFT
jgi:hypothetical protein